MQRLKAGAWRTAYRRSLKANEVEERLDLLLYRPLAFLVARCLQTSPVSPNAVTGASLLFAILSAALFWRGDTTGMLFGAASYFLCNVLDCADGQLARLQGTASPYGYLLDGAADYAGTAAVFVGVAHGLATRRPGGVLWLLFALAAAASMAFQCAAVDRKRQEWLHRVRGRRRDPDSELEQFEIDARAWTRDGSHPLLRAIVLLYGVYRRLWRSPSPAPQTPAQAAAWVDAHRPVLRRLLAVGPTAHMTALIVAALLLHPEWYLAAAILPGNAWLLASLAAAKRLAGIGRNTSPVRAILLAAGSARRLRPLTDALPKCLLDVGGESILSHTVAALRECGIDEMTLVDGFEGNQIRDTAARNFPEVRFVFIRNEEYAVTNNAYSLWLARSKSPGLVLLIDADLVFEPETLRRLLVDPRPNRLAVSSARSIGDEEVKVRLDAHERIRGIGKEIPPESADGESVGLAIFTETFARELFATLGRRIENGEGRTEWYEAAFVELIQRGLSIYAVEVGDLRCMEIDTPEDLVRARNLFPAPSAAPGQ